MWLNLITLLSESELLIATPPPNLLLRWDLSIPSGSVGQIKLIIFGLLNCSPRITAFKCFARPANRLPISGCWIIILGLHTAPIDQPFRVEFFQLHLNGRFDYWYTGAPIDCAPLDFVAITRTKWFQYPFICCLHPGDNRLLVGWGVMGYLQLVSISVGF